MARGKPLSLLTLLTGIEGKDGKRGKGEKGVRIKGMSPPRLSSLGWRAPKKRRKPCFSTSLAPQN